MKSTEKIELTELELIAMKSFTPNDRYDEGVLATWHDTGIAEKSAKGVMSSLEKKGLIQDSGINPEFSYTVWFVSDSAFESVGLKHIDL